MSEFITPYWKRLTYDPNAKNATVQEIGYAALVGGLSGAIMGGFDTSVRNVSNVIRGNNVVNSGKAADVVATAENISASETKNPTGYESYKAVQSIFTELKNSLDTTNGVITTTKQKMLVGYLERANTAAAFTPALAKNAEKIYQNAEAIANRLVEYGYKDTDGNSIVFTAEQIREGIDPNNPSTFANALKTNSILRTLAVLDTTGQIYMDTQRFADSTLKGEKLSSQVDLNRFIETASEPELKAVAEKLQIQDWKTLTNEEFKSKIIDYVDRGGVQEYQTEQKEKTAIKGLNPAMAKSVIPKFVAMKTDGSIRYIQNGIDMAITKKGDIYRIYDYERNIFSKSLTEAEINDKLKSIHNRLNDTAFANVNENVDITGEDVSKSTELSKETAEIDDYARKNVLAYAKLSDSNKNLIRGVIRQARAAGISESDALSYARVSAHAGVNIVFGKSDTLITGVDKKTYRLKYADGAYVRSTNTIYVNTESIRPHERLLIHELTHAIFNTKDGAVILMNEVKNMTDADKKAIDARYEKAGITDIDVLNDEYQAHYAEGILTNTNLLERLTSENPSMVRKILNFFKGAMTSYKEDAKLSKAANRLYKQYKKMFDNFANANQHSNERINVETESETNLPSLKTLKNSVIKRSKYGVGKQVGNNIRYSLSINGEIISGDAQEENNLIALHNLPERKLMKVLELGGFPMPSIAITKPTIKHEGFGDITVVFGKDTINPTDKRNKVYQRDAWTPTVPDVDILLDSGKVYDVATALQKTISIYSEYTNSVSAFFDEFRGDNGDYTLKYADYDAGEIGGKASNNIGMLASYLSAKGRSIKPVYKAVEKYAEGMTGDDIKRLIKRLGITKSSINEYFSADTEKPEVIEAISEFRKQYFIEKGIYGDKTIRDYCNEVKYSDYYAVLKAMETVLETNAKSVYNATLTRTALQSKIKNKADFNKWVFEQVSKTYHRKGIRNKSDIFYPSGKRRPFSALHDSYTLENIVKAMGREEAVGKGSFFGHSMRSMAAASADPFTSISGIKKASTALKTVTAEEMEAISQKTYNRYADIVASILRSDKPKSIENVLRKRDDVNDLIASCARARPLTAKNILARWNRELEGFDLGYYFDIDTATQVKELFDELQTLPTDYFEAKPRRAVGLEEIKAVILPKTASKNLVAKLDEKGIPHKFYTEESGRSEIIKKMDNIRFALPDGTEQALVSRNVTGDALPNTDTEYLAAVEKGDMETAQKMVDEAAKRALPNSKIIDKNGNLLRMYHGTNGGNFNEFLWEYTQRADGGFYGRGHYFTPVKGIAEAYGKRVVATYLNIKNPFDWEQIHMYEGKRASSVNSESFMVMINMTKQFPEIFANKTLSYRGEYNAEKGEYRTATLKYSEIEEKIKQTEGELKLLEFADGRYVWSKKSMFGFDETVGEYYASKKEADGGKFDSAIYAFIKEHDGIDKKIVSMQEYLTSDYGSEISEALKQQGYDGATVTMDGFDETVAYDSAQVKSADPVTYDDEGNVIPLSKRFSTNNNDIRYALDKSEEINLLFDEDFYKQFENEDRSIITESLSELEKARISPHFDSLPFDRVYEINSKLRALKAGYKSLYDMYVGQEKERLTKDYVWATENGSDNYATSKIKDKKASIAKSEQLKVDITAATPLQNAQFDIIQSTNPMFNDTSVGIRSPIEIKTFSETIDDKESFHWGDFSKEDAIKALKKGKVKVFSSYPIKNGVFVSTSYIQALEYAGSNPDKVHSRVVALNSVAWINGDEGQYAKVYKSSVDSKDVLYALPDTTKSILIDIPQEYKPRLKDKVFSGWTATQIAFINEQAGIEKVGKNLNVKNIEALVQTARSGNKQAEEMIAGNQYRIGADNKTYQGKGLEQIFRPINEQGVEVKIEFFDYLFNYHNISRRTLESRSIIENNVRMATIKKNAAFLKKTNKLIEKKAEQLKALGRGKKTAEQRQILHEEIDRLKAQTKFLRADTVKIQTQVKNFVPLVDKPVLDVSAAKSRQIVAAYEARYPDFKTTADEVWKFLQNLNQYRVDTGLLVQDTADYLADLYPNYVPTYRVGATKGIGAISGKYNLAVKSTVKTAKGSINDLLPPDVMIARQVMETVRAGRVNQLANALYEGTLDSGDSTYIEIVSRDKVNADEMADIDPMELRPKNNEVTFFRDGEQITMRVSKEVFAGFNAFAPTMEIQNPLVNGAKFVNKTFKRLVTSLNPAFLVRNSIRDIQEAGINTKYEKTFFINYARAVKQISTNGELWRLYKAMGGFSSSIFDFEKGMIGKQNKWGLTKAEGRFLNKGLTYVENANDFIEQIPRLMEFISSLEAGNTAEQAVLDSADVTTNFGRTGAITKRLNSTLIPFLNPAIQGCSKFIRTITSARTAKQISKLVLKISIVGIIPQLLNQLVYEDDEDYKNLRDSDKENNLLFKVGDKFIKIPKGRVASVFAGIVNRSEQMFDGDSSAWDGYMKNVMQQVTPVENLSRTVFSPFADIKNNVTWYGSAIEGRQFDNVAPKDRYDESTSSIAIALGKLINYSPKKIHYLLDQYSGVIGDFILPATTAKAEKGFLSGNFTLDPATSNKLSAEFYEIYDEAQYAKTSGDEYASYTVKYLNNVKGAISDLYKQKSEIQNSDLNDAEKIAQTKVLQALINEAYKTAMIDLPLFKNAIIATESVDSTLRYTEITRLMYGAEKALEEYDSDVYDKCKLLSKAGLNYDVLYNYYFGTKGIESDTDKRGKPISGSKRSKVVAAIDDLSLSKQQKLLLICSKGYSIQNGDVGSLTVDQAKRMLLRYLISLMGATKDEKAELAELCGFTVKNGRIVPPPLYGTNK